MGEALGGLGGGPGAGGCGRGFALKARDVCKSLEAHRKHCKGERNKDIYVQVKKILSLASNQEEYLRRVLAVSDRLPRVISRSSSVASLGNQEDEPAHGGWIISTAPLSTPPVFDSSSIHIQQPKRTQNAIGTMNTAESSLLASLAGGAQSQPQQQENDSDPDIVEDQDQDQEQTQDATLDPKDTPKRRNAYTDAQRAALRAQARSDPRPTQKQLIDWFEDKYGVRMSQSTISLILASDRPDLDDGTMANENSRKHRASDFPALEEALYAEHMRLEEAGITVTGDMIRDSAKNLWNQLECYKGKPPPVFSNGWLAGYKARYAIPMRHNSGRKRKSELPHSARPSLGAPDASGGVPAFMPPQSIRHPPYPYHPHPAYTAATDSPLHVDRMLYTRIAATAHTTGARVKVQELTCPPRSGISFKVSAGQVVRILTPQGPQVGDLNLWNQHNPRERFWAARTRQLHASHVRVFDRLWSCLPYMRPMVTVTADSLAGYGVDRCGGRCHDLLGTRCDPYVRKMLTSNKARPVPNANAWAQEDGEAPEEHDPEPGDGEDYNYSCHSNLVRAVLPHGLSESDVHDVLNVFQVTGLDNDGRYFMAPCPAVGAQGQAAGTTNLNPLAQNPYEYGPAQANMTPNINPAFNQSQAYGSTYSQQSGQPQTAGGIPPGTGEDFIELFAEIDLLCALSACPGGDLSCWNWDNDDAMKATCRPLGVEIFRLAEGQRDKVMLGWKEPKPSSYKGNHGVRIPVGEPTP